MAKKRAKNVRELSEQINKILLKTLEDKDNHVAEVIKIQESNMVEQEVYAKYTSDSESEYRYVRRGEDRLGLADTRNMKSSAKVESKGKVKMKVVNMTKGVPHHKGKNLKDGELAELVEGGDGIRGLKYSYGTGSESYMEPRPFQAETVRELEGNKMHVQALRFELRNEGLTIK